MDLSKIPEPSEDDQSYAKLLMEIVDYEKLTHHDKAHSRLIAHLLRHGRVLADSRRRFQDEGYSNLHTDECEAISFFEKFGGE